MLWGKPTIYYPCYQETKLPSCLDLEALVAVFVCSKAGRETWARTYTTYTEKQSW